FCPTTPMCPPLRRLFSAPESCTLFLSLWGLRAVSGRWPVRPVRAAFGFPVSRSETDVYRELHVAVAFPSAATAAGAGGCRRHGNVAGYGMGGRRPPARGRHFLHPWRHGEGSGR